MESTLLQKVKSLRRLKIHWNSNKNVVQKLHPNWQPIEKRVGEGGGGAVDAIFTNTCGNEEERVKESGK